MLHCGFSNYSMVSCLISSNPFEVCTSGFTPTSELNRLTPSEYALIKVTVLGCALSALLRIAMSRLLLALCALLGPFRTGGACSVSAPNFYGPCSEVADISLPSKYLQFPWRPLASVLHGRASKPLFGFRKHIHGVLTTATRHMHRVTPIRKHAIAPLTEQFRHTSHLIHLFT